MSVFDKNRNPPNPSGSGSVFDRKPAGGSPGSVFDRKPAPGPGSVFDRNPAPPGASSVFTNNSKPADTKGKKFGAPVWTGPVALKPAAKGAPKQSKTMQMMQQMCDEGDGASVGNAFDQEKGTERAKYQRVENDTTIDKQFYGRTADEGVVNSRFDPFREKYGPEMPPQDQ
uniref:Uncharacterized protein n=1 Tax=Clytia hemisphaerica TaxID=252671 RepID=A0A7M5X3W3_9CNID